MVFTRIAFSVWSINWLATAFLAVVVGLQSAVCCIVGFWIVLFMIGSIGSCFEARASSLRLTPLERLSRAFDIFLHLLTGLAVVAAYPLVHLWKSHSGRLSVKSS